MKFGPYEQRSKDGTNGSGLSLDPNTGLPHGVQVQCAMEAANEFYKNPDYKVYSKQPSGEHEQVQIKLGHRQASVDKGMAEVILGLWRRDLDTLGSCECRADGTAYVCLPVPGQAHNFYSLLIRHGVACRLRPYSQSLIDDERGDRCRVQGGKVSFKPALIPKVIAALNSSDDLQLWFEITT